MLPLDHLPQTDGADRSPIRMIEGVRVLDLDEAQTARLRHKHII